MYACVVWHAGLKVSETNDIEAIQSRALKIIYPSLSYECALEKANLTSLAYRRVELCRKKFDAMQCPNHRLNHLLPEKICDSPYDFRAMFEYPVPKWKNKRFKKRVCKLFTF